MREPFFTLRPLLKAASLSVITGAYLLGRAQSPQAVQTSPSVQSESQDNAEAQEGDRDQTYEFGLQSTILPQTLFPFHSPYQGPLSLPSYLGTRTTESFTVFLGARVSPNLDLYLDPEWLLGEGLGGATGIAGFPNVEIVRIGVKEVPYVARAFVRGTIPTAKGTLEVEAGENQIPGKRPADAVLITAGKLAATDIFDKNSYANSGRTQFMNWALVNNAAYDYDADVRGYTVGAAVEWVHPTWALRAGSFEMPSHANGPALATNFSHDRGDQAELEWHPTTASVIRLLGYRNVAHMGTYRDALVLAAKTGSVPNVTAVEKPDATKYGYGLNVEDALADNGETGLFARLGWDDGATESFAYTECDSTLSLGLQISGKRWRVPRDHCAIAYCENGLSGAHRDYLAAGGIGFIVGDGRLNYGHERILEAYYSHRFTSLLEASTDLQVIQNPGYNQDRGPAAILSFRLHYEF